MNQAVSQITSRTFAALRFRNYRLYSTSQIISFSGTWMQNIAQAWLVLELTGSGTALGTVTAMQFLPTMLLAPYGGMIADRMDKRRLIMATQASAGLLALVLGIVTLTGAVELWMVYVIAAGFGVVTAIDNPSRQTFVMEMVGPEDVTNAVTLNSVIVNVARAIGPAIGGVLIATLGIGQCFVINAVSYLAVIIALYFVRVDELHPAARTRRAPRQLREGFIYAWTNPTLRTTLLMLVVIGTFTFEFNVTLPLLADHTFGAGASGLAILVSMMGVGAVIGGLVVAATGAPTPRRLNLTAAMFGTTSILLALSPTILVAYAVVPLVGASSIAMIAISNATLQLNSAAHLRGRVMALFSVALIGSTPIGGPIIGAIGEYVSPRAGLVFGGIVALLAATYGWKQMAKTPNSPAPDLALQVSVPG